MQQVLINALFFSSWPGKGSFRDKFAAVGLQNPRPKLVGGNKAYIGALSGAADNQKTGGERFLVMGG